MSHVYCIVHYASGLSYIGWSSGKPGCRWREHIRAALRGSENCRYLYNALRKYGSEAFGFAVYNVYATEAEGKQIEAFLIQELNTRAPNGFNLTAGGEGMCHHDDTKQKMSASHKGKIFSASHRRHLSEALKGVSKSDESKQKLSNTMTGRSNPWMVEWHTTNEAREARLRASEAGAAITRGKPAHNRGKKTKPHSEETKRVMREKALIREARKRNERDHQTIVMKPEPPVPPLPAEIVPPAPPPPPAALPDFAS